jgi:DNA mismatch repair protein MutS
MNQDNDVVPASTAPAPGTGVPSGGSDTRAHSPVTRLSPTPAFHSILFPTANAPAPAPEVSVPACFPDLNLDQIVAGIIAGRDEYNLRPFLHTPAPDLETISYRHEIMRDLESGTILGFVKAFSAKMRSMREQITSLNKLYYPLQKQAVFLDAISF